MRMLAIDCATEACSVALFENGDLLAHDHRLLGRGHAERLVPMIASLPDKGRAERILVSRGPGSFTGVRIGIATARALAFAWQAELRGYPTLALVAAMLREADPGAAVGVAMNGGHGEWFVQDFNQDGLPLHEATSLPPAAAATRCAQNLVGGTRSEELVELRGFGYARALHPDARFVPALPPTLLSENAGAIYGRAPDAKPQARPEP